MRNRERNLDQLRLAAIELPGFIDDAAREGVIAERIEQLIALAKGD